MKPTYYIYYIEKDDVFQLDFEKKHSGKDYIFLSGKMLKPSQARRFGLYVKKRKRSFVKPNTNARIKRFWNEFFFVCRRCGELKYKKHYRKVYHGKCKKCYAKTDKKDKLNAYFRKRNIKIRTVQVAEYGKTKTGQINQTPVLQIKENIYQLLAERGETLRNISDYMGIELESLRRMFSKKFMDEDTMYKIAGYFMLPLEQLLRVPDYKPKEKRKFGVKQRLFNSKLQYQEPSLNKLF